jgi:uncharacterized repeat protein (TIGR03843 family)
VPGDERAPQTADLGDVTPALSGGPIAVLGMLPNASNAALLVRCGTEEDAELAVYKPARGETPLWDFPEGTLHRREVAAFEVARALGWPRVPATVLRDGPEGPGSVQRFVRFDPAEHYFTLQPTHRDVFARVAVFDLVINNADRKGGHCLLGEDGEVWMIDHGVCFAAEPKLRTVIWDFVGEPLPSEASGDLDRIVRDLGPGGALRVRLDALLAPEEVEAMRERTGALLGAGVFPEPDPTTRPFPWPPI